ncbi:spore cortex biosynthesis protein YabQ [Shimazuella sp. AN120528]|uniref:spore cortex biosynthesis protein YabQ n=1 Tax=Shimazuella soli TaxID=1892854 RepID=UPI001F115440|nr:spore cortex biosynthesis protein YabQ [Shimazuella soli]MCH5585868.1 spore cortex biosynthesis protein YabQ [Shimazuella soli]
MTLETQWITLSLMFASGALLGVFLDVYRVLARRFTLRGWPISMIDLLFWVSSACFVFGILLWSNWGEMRFYIMIAIIAGILFYLRLLTKPITNILTKLLYFVEWLIKRVIRLIEILFYRPIVRLISLLWRMFRAILLFIWKIITKPLLWLLGPVIRYCRPYTTKLKTWWASRKKNDEQ